MNVTIIEYLNAYVVEWEAEEERVVIPKEVLLETLTFILIYPSRHSDSEVNSALLLTKFLKERGEL